jgi:hypothetical protein
MENQSMHDFESRANSLADQSQADGLATVLTALKLGGKACGATVLVRGFGEGYGRPEFCSDELTLQVILAILQTWKMNTEHQCRNSSILGNILKYLERPSVPQPACHGVSLSVW